MRLLNVHTLEVSDDVPRRPAQPYAIASHRWVDVETTFQEVRKRKNISNLGYRKIEGFAEFVKDGIPSVDRIWIDTCCIDKKNSTELNTAINSMFKWYRECTVCLAYLLDVLLPDDETSFRESVWFKRGWTLQELLAPRTVVFLTRDWKVIGYKGLPHSSLRAGRCLNALIADITRIPEVVLLDYNESRELSAEEKSKWIQGRGTTLKEDMAYCQLGIHDVSMSIYYGGDSSGKKAMARLWAKIEKARAYVDIQQSDSLSETQDPEIVLVSPEATRLTRISKFGYFANQLAGIADRLIETCRSIVRPPRALKQLITACKSLSGVLHSLQNSQQVSTADVALLMRCIHNTGRSEDDFQTTIHQVHAVVDQIHGHVITDDLISNIEDAFGEVERLGTLLKFALDTYYDQRRSTQLICYAQAMNAASQVTLVPHPNTSSKGRLENDDYAVIRSGRRKPARQIFHVGINWGWLSSKVWDIVVTRAQLGWDVHFQVWNEVGYGSPIMQACTDGDTEKVRDLVASGVASLADRSGSQTLLWHAAYEGHYDMCRYLLSQMPEAARKEEMASALGMYAVEERPLALDTAIYRLFIETYEGLDVDLDDTHYENRRWWDLCRNNECRTIIFNNMSLKWSERTIEDRFKYAMDTYVGSPQEILRLCGLTPSDSRLRTLRDRHGFTALHHVAWKLKIAVSQSAAKPRPNVQEWADFGTELLRNGLDPHYAPPEQDTALIRYLRGAFQDDEGGLPYTYKKLQRCLDVWMTLVRDSGLDVGSYIDCENVMLENKTIEETEDGLPFRRLSRIVFSDELDRWSIQIREVTPVEIWTFDITPGSFSTEVPILPTICWRPTEEERVQGHWVLCEVVEIHPAIADSYERSSAAPDPFESVLDSTQDDTGVAVLLADRWDREIPSRIRSYSEPPPIRGAHVTARRSKRHWWLEEYHVCPRDGRRRPGCGTITNWISFWGGWTILGDLRACVKARSHKEASLHESSGWEFWCFLEDIANCQRGITRYMERYMKRHVIGYEKVPPLLKHTYEPKCPQGCSRVHLQKLHWTKYKN